MTGYLLDTNCISEDTLPRPNSGVSEWLHRTDPATFFLSVLTFSEIRKGIAGLTPGRRRTLLEFWLERDLRVRFGRRLLPVDESVADEWGVLDALARANGRPLAVIDGLLAATALQHDLTLVTRNVRDFAHLPVRVFSPWKA